MLTQPCAMHRATGPVRARRTGGVVEHWTRGPVRAPRSCVRTPGGNSPAVVSIESLHTCLSPLRFRLGRSRDRDLQRFGTCFCALLTGRKIRHGGSRPSTTAGAVGAARARSPRARGAGLMLSDGIWWVSSSQACKRKGIWEPAARHRRPSWWHHRRRRRRRVVCPSAAPAPRHLPTGLLGAATQRPIASGVACARNKLLAASCSQHRQHS